MDLLQDIGVLYKSAKKRLGVESRSYQGSSRKYGSVVGLSCNFSKY